MRLADFRLDEASGVRIAPQGTVPAGYLDGVEGRLAEVLTRVEDRSVHSDELRAHMVDWPSLYHLTPYRSTLFDTFGWTGAPARVLELGAGCGAVTRWLGERCGEVHAVEGDPDRATVARLRTRDLENVAVYAGNFSSLDERGFDVATYIGVLEYGHLYHPEHHLDPDAAALANLRMARSALSSDGLLVLAIENKLGMKYFNGAPEDHSARAYDGIQGYPRSSGAQTWSARELERLLETAGFAATEWFLPFPDYTLADTIISGERAADEHRLHNWISTPAPARGVDRGPVQFNETLAFREAAAAGLLVPLSNSFLVLAYAGDPAATRARLGLDTDWTARHWSLNRRRSFQKRVTLHDAGGEMVVDHEPLHPEMRAPEGPLRQRLSREPFARGDLALLEVFETFAIGADDELVQAHIEELRDHLLAAHGTGRVDPDGLPLVAGATLDAGWWNLVRDPGSGSLQAIDTEWEVVAPLPLDFVVWRALFYLAGRYQGHIALHGVPWEKWALDRVRRVFPETTDERLVWFGELEAAVVAAVGVDAQTEDVAALEALGDRPSSVAVIAAADEVAANADLLRAYAAEVRAGDPVTLLLHVHEDGAEAVVADLERTLAATGLAEDGPDMLLVVRDEDGVEELAARCRAALTDGDAPAGLPRATSTDASALRALR